MSWLKNGGKKKINDDKKWGEQSESTEIECNRKEEEKPKKTNTL